jgi:DNA-binding IclR family transcriptional regulator
MHCTGCGKAMLSQMREEDVKAIVDHYGLPQYTPTTITNYDDLMQELQRDRERGYSIDRSEETHGVKCVAVPIRSKQKVLGAVSISGSIISMQDELLPSYAEMLMDVSNLLSTKADLFPDCSILPK